MRIVFVCVEFHFIGGIPEFVDNLAAEMIAAGHHVEIVCTDYAIERAEREPRSSAPVHIVRIPATKRPSLRHPERWFRRRRGHELAEMLRRIRPDVMHSNINQWNKLPAVADAARLAGVPMVQTLHDPYGGDWSYPAPLKALGSAAILCSQSGAVSAGFARFYPPAAAARVISGGVDCARAARSTPFPRSRPYILASSRLQLNAKALDVVLEAFAALAPLHPDTDLVITGEGPDRDHIEAIARGLAIAPRVEMAGAVSRASLWDLFKGARFFVMASRRPEGLGLVFLESMAAGRPVIGTKSGGVPEIVRQGDDGLLVEHNDAREFAEAMRWMLEHPDECNRMGASGMARVRAQFDWPQVAARYLRVYEDAIASHRGA